MDENTRNVLYRSQVIDLTTTGRRTGQPRKIEIFLHNEGGLLFISGMPVADRTRDWIHNVAADPNVVVHLKQTLTTDIPATARVITDPADRRPLIEAAAQHWGRTDVDVMVRHSPLIVLTVPGTDDQAASPRGTSARLGDPSARYPADPDTPTSGMVGPARSAEAYERAAGVGAGPVVVPESGTRS